MSKKFTLEINDSVQKRLQVLCKQTNSKDNTEVIRKALVTYEVLVKAQQDGGKIFIHCFGLQQEVQMP